MGAAAVGNPDDLLERMRGEILLRKQAIECLDIARVVLAMVDLQRFYGEDWLQVPDAIRERW
jgi:hypothetical protein